MSPVTIKEFVPQDRPEEKSKLLPVFLEIWNAPENLMYLSPTLLPFEPDVVESWLQHHKEHGGRYFCALDDLGEILGVLVVKVNSLDGFEIYGVGVLPHRKGEGLGRLLVKHAVEVAIFLGFKDVRALVFADNAAMLCLLVRLGFISTAMQYHMRSDGADAVVLKTYL
ncbi:GNAT family N-acetyltransferase [Desulfoluna butyratoxydans]|uniref:Acyl-coa n-acyltransferase n=1 Tax=Desulfoluna butyratoxydans TaxID=231438 RepID=A0A4U8YNK5_9BACT|nr:GNAT family N-acetyltransferase [Desulfoluna butyratoxydans]VFQ44809.1 acyl-coa n-acyltransferase [Desulfoluna butyratoxydans]